jgi:hypothetical protein
MTDERFKTKLTPGGQRYLNRPREPLPPTYYTAHGGKPTNAMEWKAQNFGVGASYAGHGIGIDELESDWPEVFYNADCMRGFDPGAFPPPGVWPDKSEWEADEITGRLIPPWLK